MTCIVAFRNDKGVIMGGDSCAGAGSWAVNKREQKVSKVGEYLIGSSGSMRIGQVVHHALSTSKFNEKHEFYWHVVNVLVPEIRSALQNAGCLEKKDGVESFSGTLLIAHGKSLMAMYGNFSVLELDDDYMAVGCGEDLALGALYALRDNPKLPGKEKLTRALEAATKYSGFVRPPFHFVQNY